MKILIVEDDMNMAEWINNCLLPLRDALPGVVIEIVHRWELAEKVIEKDPAPDVVLLDIGLPGYDWQSIVSYVAEIEERSAVVIITGRSAEQVAEALGNSNVEIMRKSPEILQNDSIIKAAWRALLRWSSRKSQEASEERFKNIRATLAELDKRGYGTPEPSP